VGGGATPDEARQPLIKEVNGTRIGWIACNVPGPYYALATSDESALGGVRGGAAACDRAWLPEAIQTLRTQVDVVIVSVQQEEIEDYRPIAVQQYDFRQIADWGADLVIGTAAHKPQTFEFYNTERDTLSLIHYGPGNLFFDQPFWGNMRFIMDTVYLYDGRVLTDEIFPGIIDDSGRPRLMTPEEQTNFLYFMFVQQNGF
jgi:poly-gamma-glutamate capsule biosynthesis protein CapA/YwtB (metallophosphatase superfamily)